jgi:hypothetical protein
VLHEVRYRRQHLILRDVVALAIVIWLTVLRADNAPAQDKAKVRVNTFNGDSFSKEFHITNFLLSELAKERIIPALRPKLQK